MTLEARAAGAEALGAADLAAFAASLLEAAESERGPLRRVLIVPPDQTRLHSMAGPLTREVLRLLGPARAAILPATGTHRAMGGPEIRAMFGDLDPGLFRGHDHRRGNRRLGELPASFVEGLSGGRLSFAFPGEFDELLFEDWDLVLSIGQVVPHEVVGMANYTKNLVVGLGGAESISLSHWLGAVAGLESIMGRADTPVRRLLDESARRFLSRLPIVYALTVLSRDGEDALGLRGLFAGSGQGAGSGGEAAFLRASALSGSLNVETLAEPVRTCVVRLDPSEYRSTWLGNKAIYRTRMALADGAELFVLAPGVERFGEDLEIDALIRRHGYRGTPATLAAVESDPALGRSLAAAAHLIHGSSEGRFRITYCTELLSRAEVEGAGYGYAPLREVEERFGLAAAAQESPGAAGSRAGRSPSGTAPARPREGWNERGGERFFYVSNPALGLWRRAEA